MFPSLEAAIDGLVVPVDGAAIVALLADIDRLHAIAAEALGRFDEAKLWDLDDAVSLPQWLRSKAGYSQSDASKIARTAQRLHELPVVRNAWREGELTSAQVDIVLANVPGERVALFAGHEAEIVPTLVGLDARQTAATMRYWQQRADAILQEAAPNEKPQSLHLSRIGDQLVVDATLIGLGAAYVENAIRVASPNDPSMSPSERRADALVTIAKYFLDHQGTHKGGRHRPHVNVMMRSNGTAELTDGTPLERRDTEVVCCDAAFHRVLMEAASVDLDYGRATRNIPASLYAGLLARDGGCRFPGCDRTADLCDVHDVEWWDHGGITAPSKTALMCLRHHQKIHEPGWHATLLPNADLHVTKPDGTELVGAPRGIP
ncbi:MAG: DUF222 domain-containing protein [Acidimicrobiia bacterium]